jgi:FixJ family two-component response regulator
MQTDAELPFIGIVHDHESTEGISSLLRSAGYRAVVFESAEPSLDGDHKHEMRCLILDIDMPGLGGLELQRHLARINAAIPIILATAQADVLRARALKEGASAALRKSFTEEALLSAIRLVLVSRDNH